MQNWLFSVCPPPPPPSLVGAYYLHPPDPRAIFLNNDLLCNGSCSVTGGRITYWGGTKGKDPQNYCQVGQYKSIFCPLKENRSSSPPFAVPKQVLICWVFPIISPMKLWPPSPLWYNYHDGGGAIGSLSWGGGGGGVGGTE